MKEKDISARQLALNKSLIESITKKIDTIKENIIFEKGSDRSSYFQMLIMIDEDLDDVLLNWEYDAISTRTVLHDNFEDDDLDDDDY